MRNISTERYRHHYRARHSTSHFAVKIHILWWYNYIYISSASNIYWTVGERWGHGENHYRARGTTNTKPCCVIFFILKNTHLRFDNNYVTQRTCRGKLGNGEKHIFINITLVGLYEVMAYKKTMASLRHNNYVTQRTCKLLPRSTFLST